MQNTNTIIKKLDMYIPAAKIFQVLPSEENAIFLDSSLVNELGHYSIIGRKPYLKLEKREDRFYINDTEETSISFENYLRSYLDKQKTANSSHLPLASGALGYFSYEYGRRLMGIPSSHKDTISIPDAVLIFYDAFIIEDCHKKESYLITNGITEPADILLKKLEDAILKTSDSEPVKPVKEKYPIQVHANFEKEDYKKSISNIVCWPQSLSELLSKELKKQLQKMQGEQAVKISYDDNVSYLQHCPTLLEGKEGFDLYTFKYNELLSREDLWQASEFVQLYSHIWNKDLGKLVTSELVRAIIDDDPLKMRRLADLFQINVAELNQMWVFASVDSSELDLKLLRKCTEYFSGIYKTVLVGYYESNMVIFAHAPQTAGERDAIVQDFINESADSYSNYIVVCCDCLNTTNDAHNAYFDVMQYASYARSIYPQKRVLRPSDVSFASICAKEAACREAQIHYLKIIEDIETTPELLTTLTAYLLDHESSMANTAKALCCHINTIKYRLNSIRDNTGYSPSKPADVYPLLIAVAINRMKNSEND